MVGCTEKDKSLNVLPNGGEAKGQWFAPMFNYTVALFIDSVTDNHITYHKHGASCIHGHTLAYVPTHKNVDEKVFNLPRRNTLLKPTWPN